MTARTQRIDFESGLNTLQLVSATSAVGRRGKSAGFYCEVCNLTYKDSIQWVDHLNSKQHLYAIGDTNIVRRSTVEEVQKRIEWLSEQQKKAHKDLGYDINERIEKRKELIKQQRLKRKQKKEAKRDSLQLVQQSNIEIAETMGFANFGSTKSG